MKKTKIKFPRVWIFGRLVEIWVAAKEGRTKAELAERLGILKQNLRSWETGARTPSWDATLWLLRETHRAVLITHDRVVVLESEERDA